MEIHFNDMLLPDSIDDIVFNLTWSETLQHVNMIPVLDEFGDPVDPPETTPELDDQGNPVMVDDDDPTITRVGTIERSAVRIYLANVAETPLQLNQQLTFVTDTVTTIVDLSGWPPEQWASFMGVNFPDLFPEGP